MRNASGGGGGAPIGKLVAPPTTAPAEGAVPGPVAALPPGATPGVTPQRAFRGELDEDIGTAEIIELREKFAIAEIRQVKAGAEIRVKDRVVPR